MSYLRTRPELLASFRDGNRAAMSEVYDAYLPRLHGLLERGFVVRSSGLRVPPLVSPDDRADTIHEVFLRAFKREARLAYDGERDYWPYIATIARNALVSLHRKHGRELPASDRESYEDANVIDGEGDAEPAHFLEPKSLELVRQYVASLPAPLRALHTARYVDELSQRDAAEQLGLSRARVRELEANLLRELARLLKRAGIRASADRITPSPGSPSHG